MRYRLSALAEQDLHEIWFYIAEEATPTTADRHAEGVLIARVLHGRRDQAAAWSE